MADEAETQAADPKDSKETQGPGDEDRNNIYPDLKDTQPADELFTPSHSITVDGTELRYTATAGRIVLFIEAHTDDKFDGPQAKAEVFMIAYTADDTDPAGRPVTFAFNGGPGSSSIWLHLGVLGPRRVLMGDAGELLPPPYGLADNAQTLLRHSDLVFIDPVSTGYSRAVKGEKSRDFHGFGGDIESVGEMIRLWTTRNGRWMSPKYLCGESYGTTRAAALARHLQERYGLYLNGLMLISCFLNGGSVGFTSGNDDPYVNYLPTYAAIANYHGKHGDRPLREVLAEAQEYAASEYPRALALGSRLSAEDRAVAVARIAALNHYVRAELGYSSDLPYEVLTDRVQPWSYKEFEAQHLFVLDKLAEAMRVNPHMRLHVACGYYDAATPYLAAENDIAHLAIPAQLASNVEFAYYEAGHMMYMHEPSRLDQSERLAAFVTGTS